MYQQQDGQPNISLSFKYQTDVIVGEFEITNLDVYAQYQGARVTEVPAGANFEIHADYLIRNLNPSILFPLWTTCMTVYNVTEGQPVDYDTYGEHIGGGTKDAHDAINTTMPDVPTTYRVKIFANQEQGAGAPPTNQW